MDGSLALDDPALADLLCRPLMLLDHVDALDHDPALLRDDAKDAPALPSLLTRHDDYRVALPNVCDGHRPLLLAAPDETTITRELEPRRTGCHQMTSGASEMILVNCLSRNSRATGPKMRVPTGLSSAFKSTTAFLSNRMYEPSRRPTSFTVRTTTPRATSRFLTGTSATASLPARITTSPSDAYRLLAPPITRMHCAFLAPELSATSSMVLGWITASSPVLG